MPLAIMRCVDAAYEAVSSGVQFEGHELLLKTFGNNWVMARRCDSRTALMVTEPSAQSVAEAGDAMDAVWLSSNSAVY
jgi:hypothetical protein